MTYLFDPVTSLFMALHVNTPRSTLQIAQGIAEFEDGSGRFMDKADDLILRRMDKAIEEMDYDTLTFLWRQWVPDCIMEIMVDDTYEKSKEFGDKFVRFLMSEGLDKQYYEDLSEYLLR